MILKKYPNFIFNNERYQIFTVIYNKDIKILNNHLDYINELQDLSNYYISYESKLDDEIILLIVVNKDKEIVLGVTKLKKLLNRYRFRDRI